MKKKKSSKRSGAKKSKPKKSTRSAPVYVSELKAKKSKAPLSSSKSSGSKEAYRFIAESYAEGAVKKLKELLPDRLFELVAGILEGEKNDASPAKKKTQGELARLRKQWVKKKFLDLKPVKALRSRRPK